MNHCKPAACTLAFFASVGPLLAQAGFDAALRSSEEVGTEQREQIRAEVDGLTKQLENGIDDERAARKFRDAIIENHVHAANSVAFRRAFAEESAKRFAAGIAQGGKLGRILAETLTELSDPKALEALQAAARTGDEAVRAVSIQGIRQLAPEIQQDEARVALVVNWLGEAGKAESSPVVLPRIYQALEYESKKPEQGQAILGIFRERLNAFARGEGRPYRCELQAFARLSVLLPSLPEALKKELVDSLAKFLTYYCYEYIYVDLDAGHRADLMRLAFMVEDLLGQITGAPAPDGGVTAAMGSASPQRYEAVRTALQAWVGGPGGAGRLNAAPWQVPQGSVPSLDFAAPIPEHPEPVPAGGGP